VGGTHARMHARMHARTPRTHTHTRTRTHAHHARTHAHAHARTHRSLMSRLSCAPFSSSNAAHSSSPCVAARCSGVCVQSSWEGGGGCVVSCYERRNKNKRERKLSETQV
jgi:hypothetical protein